MTDQVFALSEGGLAVLLVETPEEGAHKVLQRLTAELEQVLVSFGYSLTSFPVDANLAEDFLNLAMERHNNVARQMYTNNDSASSAAPPRFTDRFPATNAGGDPVRSQAGPPFHILSRFCYAFPRRAPVRLIPAPRVSISAQR